MEFLFTSFVPFLSGIVTTQLAIIWPVCASVVAASAVTFSISSPVSSNAVCVDPYLTFCHASHVQSQRLISFWFIKIRLQVQQLAHKCIVLPISVGGHLQKVSFFHTLYHVNGCIFGAAKDNGVHSKDWNEFHKLIASPVSPICVIYRPYKWKLLKFIQVKFTGLV